MQVPYEVLITNAARQDLEAIIDWIAQDNAEQAFSFVLKLKQALLERLKYTPMLSTEIGGVDGFELRRFLVEQYWIVFRISTDDRRCEVLRVLHTSRHFDDLNQPF